MIFKPKIFISSTLGENQVLRKDVKEYFEMIGAEPLLYEYNLTPSTKPLTYRTDILEADFIILIIKDKYGTRTKSGFSGTHEEYKISSNKGIPIHVYLKKHENGDEEENELIDELKNEGISYYYFENDDEVLKHIKETTFVIAKEIMLNQIVKNKLPRDTVVSLASNTDYYRAMEVISIIEEMRKVVKANELDLVYSTIFVECLERIRYEFSVSPHDFINWKIDDGLKEMLEIANEFIKQSAKDFIARGIGREYKISVLGKVPVYNLSNNNCSSSWGIDNYKKCLEKFYEKYEEFKDIVKKMKMEADIIK